MMHTVFDHLNTMGMYLKSKNFHWAFILEGEFYVEGGFILKTSLLRKSKNVLIINFLILISLFIFILSSLSPWAFTNYEDFI